MLNKKQFTRFEDHFENESLTALWFINSVLAPKIRPLQEELERLKNIVLKTDEIQDDIIKIKSRLLFLINKRNELINSFGFEEETTEEFLNRINEHKEDN